MGGEFRFGSSELHLWVEIKTNGYPSGALPLSSYDGSSPVTLRYCALACVAVSEQGSIAGLEVIAQGSEAALSCFEMQPLRGWLQNHSTDRVMGQWRESLARPGDVGDFYAFCS